MAFEYHDCFFCGGEVREQFTPREIHWKGKLFIFENVPLGICVQCGEKVIKPEVAKAIDQVLLQEKQPIRIIEVPVYRYEPSAA
jgi:YgiT-type zinc finger domain-containing protein